MFLFAHFANLSFAIIIFTILIHISYIDLKIDLNSAESIAKN